MHFLHTHIRIFNKLSRCTEFQFMWQMRMLLVSMCLRTPVRRYRISWLVFRCL